MCLTPNVMRATKWRRVEAMLCMARCDMPDFNLRTPSRPEGDLASRLAETLEQHEPAELARFLEGAVRVATAILEMTSANREYAARVFKNTRANHSEIKAFFDCALKGLPFDLALRTTIRACPRCTMFFNLIKASVQAHVPAPARLCPEVPSACDHPSVTTAEGLIVLANWPPRPI